MRARKNKKGTNFMNTVNFSVYIQKRNLGRNKKRGIGQAKMVRSNYALMLSDNI